MKKERKSKKYLFLFFPVMFLIICPNMLFSQSNIEIDVFSGGGGDGLSTHYDLFSLMGQPSAIGTSSSDSYSNYAGFIWALIGAPLPCECDLNHDSRCDMLDWLLFGQDWGRTDCLMPGVTCECDLNVDGRCDMLDWLLFGKNWGRTDCPIL